MAKKFQFRLEVVRQLRKQARDQAARTLALQQAATNAAQARVDQIAERLESEQAAARSQRQLTRLDLAALRRQQYHAKWLDERMVDSSLEVQRQSASLAVEREKLGRALAALKGIEKLKERRLRKYLWELRREEQIQTDEVAGRQACLNASPGEIQG